MTDNTLITAARRTAMHVPYVSALLSAAALMIHLYHPWRIHLLYARTALADGEFWRAVTGHWVHLNTDHLLWSTMTFLLLGSVCEIMNRARYILAIGISVVIIPSAIWLGMPGLEIYGGLSGLDCALYALPITLFIRREIQFRKWFWSSFFGLVLMLLLAKIIYEAVTGQTIFVSNAHQDMLPVPLAHLVGGVVGCAVGLISLPDRLTAQLGLHKSYSVCKKSMRFRKNQLTPIFQSSCELNRY